MKKFIIFGALFGLLIVPLSTLGLASDIAEIIFVPFILIPRWLLSLIISISGENNQLMFFLISLSILWYVLVSTALFFIFKKVGKWGVVATILVYYLLIAFCGISTVKTTSMPVFNNDSNEIRTFEDCVLAGNPIIESYPRECRGEYGIFIERIEKEVKKSIPCNGPPEVCSKKLRCKDGFVTEDVEVCGKINVQCITTPCDPVEETFKNRCEARERGAFDIKQGSCEYWTETNKFIQTQGPVTYSIEYPKNWFEHNIGNNIIFTQSPTLKIPPQTESYAIGPHFSVAVNNFADSSVDSYIKWLDLYGMTDKNPLFIVSSDENINGYQMKRVITEAAGAGGEVLHYIFFVDIQRILVFSQYPFDINTETSKDFENIISTFKIEDIEKEIIGSSEVKN